MSHPRGFRERDFGTKLLCSPSKGIKKQFFNRFKGIYSRKRIKRNAIQTPVTILSVKSTYVCAKFAIKYVILSMQTATFLAIDCKIKSF